MARPPEAPGPRGDTLVGATGVTAPPSPVITVRGLHMSYASLEAVRGIDLEVHAGEVFAFLGPNGAGKTTTVEILEGFRRRTRVRCRFWARTPSGPEADGEPGSEWCCRSRNPNRS